MEWKERETAKEMGGGERKGERERGREEGRERI